jgi:hypothetical protein
MRSYGVPEPRPEAVAFVLVRVLEFVLVRVLEFVLVPVLEFVFVAVLELVFVPVLMVRRVTHRSRMTGKSRCSTSTSATLALLRPHRSKG